MKIALVYPPSQELNLKGYPLGLAYLSSILKKTNEVNIFNYNGKNYNRSLRDFFKSIQVTKPDLVGISFNSFNREGAFRLLKNIKRVDKKIIVVLGGVHPSVMHEQIFNYFYDEIDFIIRSEGELPFAKLCEALSSKKDFSGISGLVYKDGKGKFIVNPISESIDKLDDLPLPDYSYAQQEIREKETAFLITSRGCPVNCYFCSTSSFWGQNIRANSPERIGAEVEYVKKLGAKRLFFHDDTFNLGIERTIEIARVLKRMSVEYAIQCRVKPVNEEMIAELAGSGCKHISWGAESLSDKILEKTNKKITKEDVKNAFDICAKYNDKFTTSAYFCVGMPGESEETIRESLDYLNRNIKSTHGPGASMLYILPGTRLYEDLLKAKKFNEKLWVESSAVYYYTQEHGIRVLNRWRKLINQSGIRLPYNFKYFFDEIPSTVGIKEGAFRKKYNKVVKKIKKFFNLMRNRY